MSFSLPTVDWEALVFRQPEYLWLLLGPAVLLAVWTWQFVRRRADVRRYLRHRAVPVRERFSAFGGLLFWLCLIGATACVILALARPQVVTTRVRRAGIDLVVLQDGSTSMRVTDMPSGDRWRRSMAFLRTLGEAMRWDGDRIAMTSFARIATPQVRLTKDPNTFFFFIDHLTEPPFRAEDDASWDTNIEMGISWALKLLDQDERILGRPSVNAKAFLLLSDGQAWSGDVERAIQIARERRIPIYVVGVGTSNGGFIPEPPSDDAERASAPIYSRLDRASLAVIAAAGGGRYLELDRERDTDIAVTVIDQVRKLARGGVEEGADDVYWPCLAAAAIFLLAGIAAVRDRAELALATLGAFAALAVVQLV
ncbi:MAG: VWA domain-containing protein [Vicinamibacterales bacterium]